jgi:hypothetical protein
VSIAFAKGKLLTRQDFRVPNAAPRSRMPSNPLRSRPGTDKQAKPRGQIGSLGGTRVMFAEWQDRRQFEVLGLRLLRVEVGRGKEVACGSNSTLKYSLDLIIDKKIWVERPLART